MPRGWEIEVHEDGKCDVTQNSRARAYDLDDVTEAMGWIRRWRRRHQEQIERVTVVEFDGYRRTVRL